MTVFRQENVDDYYDTGEELGRPLFSPQLELALPVQDTTGTFLYLETSFLFSAAGATQFSMGGTGLSGFRLVCDCSRLLCGSPKQNGTEPVMLWELISADG
ncbi:Death-associated protein kinase 1 [Manis javanica]|nr:Death-associated protein kinase 1 [Manis javanica]